MNKNENNNYIIQKDYHGDVKLTKLDNSSTILEDVPFRKKVDLSKPTDKTIQPIVNLNIPTKMVCKDVPICLTKPNDIPLPTPKIKSNNSKIINPKINKKTSKIQLSHVMQNKSIFASNKTMFIISAIMILVLILLNELS